MKTSLIESGVPGNMITIIAMVLICRNLQMQHDFAKELGLDLNIPIIGIVARLALKNRICNKRILSY